MGKDERLHLRLDAASRKKLKRACELTGLDEPTALRACVQAFVEHIEENGGIWLPLAIVPKSGFSEAGEKTGAGAGGPSSSLTRGSRIPPPSPEGDPRLNESPPASPPPSLPSSAPRLTRARATLREMTRKEKKPPIHD